MTYYRVAVQVDQSPTWRWKSSMLTSLDALFGFFKLYYMVPRERLRVFFSSSVEYLDEMLARENQGLASNSLNAEQLLNGSKHIDLSEMKQLESECGLCQSIWTVVTSPVREQARYEQGHLAPVKRSTNSLDMRRLELELATTTDHDSPYRFTLPTSLPQILAWTRLLARVQRGEVEP